LATVYRAFDPKLRRDVAVKIIHPHLSENPKFVRRFEEEAAAVAQLRHPNIRQVFDSGHDGEIYYMVLEFLPGETLKERLYRYTQNGQLMPLSEVIPTIQQICSAIAYAHKNRIIHRDIKPSNVVINTQGEAILTDFGIAKMVGIEEFTATGAVIGTAAYISPEQTQGERVDHRTDIYAIGVMLYEMVSGAPPFEADSVMSLMMKHVNEPVPDLHQRNPTLHPGIVEIIEKALAKKPAKRYQNADEIAADLAVFSIPESSSRDETIIEDTMLDSTAPVAAIQDQLLPHSSTASQTFRVPRPEIEEEPETTGILGIPRRILELVSAAIGGGTVVVLALICLIAAAVVIVPRFFTPTEPILNPTFFVRPEDSTSEPLPEMGYKDLENNPVSLDEHLGQWVLVQNWGVDCPDCQSNNPELEAYHQNHQEDDFTVIGINAGDDLSEVEAYLQQNPVSYPVWLDPDQETIQAFGDEALPSYILLTPKGAVHSTFQGVINQDFLEEYITPLLSK